MWKNGSTAITRSSSSIVPHGLVLAEVRDEVAVRQHDALGKPGRAARERQRDDVAWPGRSPASAPASRGGASRSANGVVPAASPIENTSSTPAPRAASSARSASAGDGHEEAGAGRAQLERGLLGRVERVDVVFVPPARATPWNATAYSGTLGA